eukprot:gene13010-3809_t
MGALDPGWTLLDFGILSTWPQDECILLTIAMDGRNLSTWAGRTDTTYFKRTLISFTGPRVRVVCHTSNFVGPT